jgi:hypothetical protein
MSQAKFDKAVKIVQGLPKDGPVKPTTDDQLYVRFRASYLIINSCLAFVVLTLAMCFSSSMPYPTTTACVLKTLIDNAINPQHTYHADWDY